MCKNFMVIRHSIKELLAKSMVTRPMKCIVVKAMIVVEWGQGKIKKKLCIPLAFVKILDYPMTCLVKLSLNFDLLVNRIMEFLLGQRLINNNIFCTT